MTRAQEDEVVAVLLRYADEPNLGAEVWASTTLDAYRGLARSRGVDLETVLRHACRNDLAAVVRRPVRTTT